MFIYVQCFLYYIVMIVMLGFGPKMPCSSTQLGLNVCVCACVPRIWLGLNDATAVCEGNGTLKLRVDLLLHTCPDSEWWSAKIVTILNCQIKTWAAACWRKKPWPRSWGLSLRQLLEPAMDSAGLNVGWWNPWEGMIMHAYESSTHQCSLQSPTHTFFNFRRKCTFVPLAHSWTF